MSHFRYLIIGGGMTGDAATRGIREVDASGSIGMISAESHLPYNRPPLSKALWKGQSKETIWRRTERRNVEVLLNHTATRLNPAERHVLDDQGTAYSFEKLLLATGGTPRRLSFGNEDVIYFRSLDDYERLRRLIGSSERVAVIGGGFIGSEIAAALAMNGINAAMLFPDEGIGARLFPSELATFLNDYYRAHGVEVLPGETVVGLEVDGTKTLVKTRSGRVVVAGGVVAGIGIQPNTALAEAAGLQVDNGVVVDEFLRTSHPDVYAAGDVARFYNPALGSYMRVEHEDNANTMGKVAGQNMAGRAVAYHHLPFFYSDLFDLGYEAVGELDSRFTAVEDWKEPQKEGVVYYLRDGRVRGVLLWNVWGEVDRARALIAEPGPFTSSSLTGRIGSSSR
jgi:3-phenylpropionate/trans-cinnamate dioxygenase ferredoxin reductase subunit